MSPCYVRLPLKAQSERTRIFTEAKHQSRMYPDTDAQLKHVKDDK